MIDFDYLTTFNILAFIYCCFSKCDKLQEKEDKAIEEINQTSSAPTHNFSIKTSLDDKIKEIESNINNYRTLDSFIEYWTKNGLASESDFNYVLEDICKKYNKILLDLSNSQDFYFEEQDLIVINLELLIFSLNRKTPILIDKVKSAIIQ